MTDFKISKKPHFSLASRVVLVITLLIVLPLLLQSAFLYKQEYKQKIASVQQILTLVAKERVERIAASLTCDWTVSDPASPYPVQFSIAEKGVPPNSLTVILPVPGSTQHLVASLPHSFIRSWHNSDFFYRLTVLILCVGGIGGLAVILLTRRIARPLRQLCTTLERVSEGAIHVRYTPDWMGFEIN